MNSYLRSFIILIAGLGGAFVGFMFASVSGFLLWPIFGTITGAFGAMLGAEFAGRHLDQRSRVDYVHEAVGPVTFVFRVLVWIIFLLVLFVLILQFVLEVR